MYTAVWNSVSSTSYMGGRELWNEKSSLAGIDGDKDYTCRLLYVCVCFVYEFVYKHVLNQIPLSPAVAPRDSTPPTPNRVGSILLSQ